MRFFYLANIRFPTEKAHGVQIAKMCEGFGLENEVVLIVPWRFNSIKQNVFDYYQVKNNFKVVKLPSLDLIILGIPKIGFIIQSLTFSISAFIYFLFKKTDVIYTRGLLLAWLLSAIKKNVFLELHTLPSWLNRRYLRKLNGIIVITQFLRNELVKNGIAENRILVASDGVDMKQFDVKISKEKARQKLLLPLDKKIILYTGHLYKWKGAHILAEAAQFLNSDCLVVFVGGVKKDIKKFRSQFSNLKNILILGYKPYLEIPYYLKAADALILPNSVQKIISRHWTSPIKMFEYMASQRLIIASDLPSIREILNKNNAILVEPDNPKKLAENIKKSLKNPDFFAKLSQQAYSDVQQHTWNKRAGCILKFIKSLIHNG